ncbi:MAG: DegT/DnrJ/EryC1/StrS family aminotransferase [Bacteroidales bacterium]|jgi:dTDP-4-amino-4,6-dideoxygalactose transaminase
MIPFVDLYLQYCGIKSEIDSAIKECIAEGNFIKGKAVSDFESAFAEYIGAQYCMGCGNGTDALEIILKSLNIGPGDEVIVPALTWIATAEAVNNVGAEPVFAEINPINYTIDYNSIEAKIAKKTKAIIPVHLFGCPADMNEILKIAGKYRLFVIEDCAQAHGAEYSGRKVGTFGIASAFSFFPSKNLGAFGDGGAIVTNNKELAILSRKISNHGQLQEKHKHFMVGRNSRLDSIQAAVLTVKLKYLDEWNLKRQQVALYYISRLKDNTELKLPIAEQDKKHVYHLFAVRCRNREKLIRLLDEKDISWGIHYPKPIPFLDAYSYKKHKPEDFTIASSITDEIISIPIYPEITTDQLNVVCDQLLKYEKV